MNIGKTATSGEDLCLLLVCMQDVVCKVTLDWLCVAPKKDEITHKASTNRKGGGFNDGQRKTYRG